MQNPKVYLSLTANDKPIGKLVFELRPDKALKTVENFRALCTNEKGFGYKGCLFYRVIPTFCACAQHNQLLISGDFETNNADRSGGHSIFEEKYFADEHNDISHDRRGVLSMDNYGWPDTNSSRFFITFGKCEWMNGYHIAFGQLVDGWDTLDRLESYGTIEGFSAQKGITTEEIRIADCGEL